MNDRMTTLPAPVALPLRISRLTRNEAQARTLLAQRARDCEISLGDAAWRLSIDPLASQDGTALGGDDWRVKAEWAGAPFELRLPALACEQWLRARFPGLDLPALAPELRAAALEAALDQALGAVLALQRGPARIASAEGAGKDDASLSQRFGFLLQHEQQAIHGSLCTNSLGLMLMAGLVAQRPAAQGPLAADALPLVLRAEIGVTVMPASQLATLQAGDAILVGHAWIAQDAQLWLAAGDWGLRVKHEDTKLVVTQPFNKAELNMATETETAAGESAVALDSLPVRLHFDLGERSITLGEAKALQVGQTLELARPLSQAVNIRANGALVGTGELVEIDGKLAVSITSLGGAGRG